MERAYITHYSTQQTDEPSASSPVIWDFNEERLVEPDTSRYTVDESEDDSSFTAVAVSAGANGGLSKAFWLSLGFLLDRVPAGWFHGVFAGLTLVMGYLLARG